MKPKTAHAFPITVDLGNGATHYQLGITKRDYFAAKAMQTLMVRHASDITDNRSFIAQIAYQMADAMLTESNK